MKKSIIFNFHRKFLPPSRPFSSHFVMKREKNFSIGNEEKENIFGSSVENDETE